MGKRAVRADGETRDWGSSESKRGLGAQQAGRLDPGEPAWSFNTIAEYKNTYKLTDCNQLLNFYIEVR